MRRTLSAVLLALGLLFIAAPALAEAKSSVQVLAIASEDSFEQAQALTIALKRAVTRAEGWTLAKGDFSLEVMTAAMGCPLPPDSGCQKKISDKTGAKRYIWGTLSKSGKKEVTAILRLWEDGSQKKDTQFKYASNLTDASDDQLLSIASDAFARLTGEATGVVVVTAGNVNGKVFVDGKEVGAVSDGRTELTLPAGEHRIVVRADGYNDATGNVTVHAGASAEVALNPTAAPAGKSGSDATHDEGTKGNTKKMIGYAAVGVGAVLTVAGGYFWLRSAQDGQSQEIKDYAAYLPKSNNDPCGFLTDPHYPGKVPPQSTVDAARTKCDDNAGHKKAAMILTPVGLVLGGVGAYLLFTSDKEKAQAAKEHRAPRPRLTPLVAVGPRGGEFLVNVPF